MIAAKVAVATVLPATIVSARFIMPAVLEAEGSLALFFALAGFLSTAVGCLIAALALRRRIALVPLFWVAAIAVLVATILLSIFPTMPTWPFTGEGFIVAWVLMSAVFTAALLYAVGFMPNKRFNRDARKAARPLS